MRLEMPKRCPFCKGPMLNSYSYWTDGRSNLHKTCDKHITHNISFESLARDHDQVNKISLNIRPSLTAKWALWADTLTLLTSGRDIKLPFFEPDLSNYNKLLNKLKTYLIFS